MVSVPDTSYNDPSAWRIAMDASGGTLSMNTSKGPRLLYELPDFHGAFYLHTSGALVGFALRLPLPSHPAWLPEDEAPVLSWESGHLETDGAPNEIVGRARLWLGRQQAFTTVTGRCTEVPVGRSGRSYLKIVLETAFSSLSLRWPPEARQRLRPVTLKLFSEIRSAGIVPGSIPEQPR